MTPEELLTHRLDDIKRPVLSLMHQFAMKEAIAFAEWVDMQGYTCVNEGRWESLNDMTGKNIDQLYNLFCHSKQ